MRPILFTVARWQVASAPVFAGLAALASYFYFELKSAELALSEDDFWAVIAALAFGVFAGAVGFYALVYGGGLARNVEYLLRNRTVEGGSFLGTYLGAALCAWLYCRLRGLSFAPVGDVLGAAAPLGLSIMRIGCLLNGCCYGRPTTLPWGIVFHRGVPARLRGIPLHPTQVYELLGSLVIFAIVDRLLRPRVADGRLRPGDALAGSIALYSLLRFLNDFVRAGDPGIVATLGLTAAQWLAVAAMTTVCVRFAARRERSGAPARRGLA